MSIIFDFFVGLFRLGQCYRRRLNLAFASQVARETLCNDLFVIPRAVCVGEALAKKGFSWSGFPSFRIRCGDFRDPGSERASPERTQEDPCCPEHCRQWFRNCASKLGDGELVVPCLCPVFCGNWFYEKALPCFIVSVIRMLGVLGPQNLKPPKDNQKLVLRTCALTRLMKDFFG